jgi:hypothetical protein
MELCIRRANIEELKFQTLVNDTSSQVKENVCVTITYVCPSTLTLPEEDPVISVTGL